jgi:hypothetical protein
MGVDVRKVAIALGGLGATLLIGAIALDQWAGFVGGALAVLGSLFVDQPPMSKLLAMLLILTLLAMLAVGAAGFFRRSRGGSDILFAVTFAAPLLSLAAGALTGVNIYRAVQATHVSRFIVIAPTVAEAIFIVGLGALVGGVAGVVNLILQARSRST